MGRTLNVCGVRVGTLKCDGGFPCGLALPGGMAVVDVADDEDTKGRTRRPLGAAGAPQVVVVRCRRRIVACDNDIVAAAARAVRKADLVVVDGVALDGEQTLGKITMCRGVRDAATVKLYDRTEPVLAPDGSALPVGLAMKDADLSCATVDVDAIAYASLDACARDVIELLAQAFQQAVEATLSLPGNGSALLAHYPVLDFEFALTIASPLTELNEDEATSVSRRKLLHEALGLPMNRPCLRSSCRVYKQADGSACNASILQSGGGYSGRLPDVHLGIKAHGLGEAGVSVHLVQGQYLYCHYLQDRFKDSGWGCAYRSLQTIFSWCALERYADFDGGVLPTHIQIQQALVDVGDKPKSFVGSKDWIGANEVCYALEKLTGLTSKILHVSRGSDIESKSRELARHFDEQGSPIMVGGGVLAWTILGVARDSRTGKARFLILDPHYEGRDDLKIIQSKGWVGWKSADVFKASAFYNLCMPIRPSLI